MLPSTLPQECATEKCLQFAALTYSGLLRAERFGEKIKYFSELAESWSADKDQITIKLHPAARWSGGARLQASDFVRSTRVILSNPSRFPAYTRLFPLRNARLFVEGQVGFAAVGIKALDGETLRLLLEPGEMEPTYDEVEALLSHPILWPLPPFRPTRQQATLGPLLAPLPTTDHRQRFLRDSTFVGTPVGFEELELHVLEDVAQRVELFLQGETDFVDDLTGELPTGVMPKLQTLPSNGLVALAFRPSRRPFQHRPVREAFQQTIDRQELVGSLPLPMSGVTELSETPGGPSRSLSEWLPRFSSDAAKQRLSVYRFGTELFRNLEGTVLKSFPNPSLSFPDSPLLRACAENLQAQWAKKLNVAVDLTPNASPPSMALLLLHRGFVEERDAAMRRWNDELSRLTGLSFLNNESAEPDTWWVRKQAVVTPLFAVHRPYLLSDRLSGLKLSPVDYWDLRKVEILN